MRADQLRIERMNDDRQNPRVSLAAIRARKPEFADVPASLIPWLYRTEECVEPTHCPRCGRRLIQYVWGDEQRNGPNPGYLEAACAGRWQWLAALRPSWLFFAKHWGITLDRARRLKVTKIRYDPTSGEPMDGPAQR